jgi:hypothetical protein
MTDAARTLNAFSFADGQYLAHITDGNTCAMEFRNWEERVYRFVFSGVALIRCYCGSVSLCEAVVNTQSDLIEDCRAVLARDWGTSGGPQEIALTELTLIDDVPVFTVVFADVRILGPIDESERLNVPEADIPG